MDAYFLLGLIPLLVIGLIAAAVAGIIVLSRRGDNGVQEPGLGTVRRLFYYGVGFIALMVAAGGAQSVLSELLEAATTDVIVRGDSTQLALGLAAVIVGAPVWLGFWLMARRSLDEFQAEVGTVGRKLYAYGSLTVAAGVAAQSATTLVVQVFGGEYRPAAVAGLIVWAAVWGFHWRIESHEGQPTGGARTVRRMHVYSAAAYGVVLLTVGVGTLIAGLLNAAYVATFTDALILRGGPTFDADQLRRGGALAVVGGLWWWWYWHRAARGDTESLLRQWVLYGLGVFGGAAAMAGFSIGALSQFLAWSFDTKGIGAAAAMDFLPMTVGGAVAGAALWSYHAAAARQEADSMRAGSGQRTYRYLLAATGLGLVIIGATSLVAVVIGQLSPGAAPFAARGVWWAGPLAAGISTAVVGAPLWFYHWSHVQALAATGPTERFALARRVYLYGVGGATTLASTGALIALIVTVLSAVLDGDMSWRVLQDSKWALAVVAAAGGAGVYHWRVLRRDGSREQDEGAAPAAVRKSVLLVAGGNAAALATALSQHLGHDVSAWRRTDDATADLSSAALESLASRIASAPGGRVLVVLSAGDAQVIPYDPA